MITEPATIRFPKPIDDLHTDKAIALADIFHGLVEAYEANMFLTDGSYDDIVDQLALATGLDNRYICQCYHCHYC